MNTRISTIVILCFTLFFSVVYAQDDNKDVIIKASGSGKTLDDAKQAALRSSTQQAFGAFISSKTEIFNDQLVVDQMASVSSGNIKSYEVLNESQLPDNSWGVTLKVVLSINKLQTFVEAKGIAIEIKGGMFALYIKQQLLNEQGEIAAVYEMVGLLHQVMQTSFDYAIKSSEPQSTDSESKEWEIPLEVTATANKNMDFCANYFEKTLAALSLSPDEVKTYQSINKEVFPVIVNYENKTKMYFLRNKYSIYAIKSFTSNFYQGLFVVQSGMDESYNVIENSYNVFEDTYQTESIDFLIRIQRGVSKFKAEFSYSKSGNLILEDADLYEKFSKYDNDKVNVTFSSSGSVIGTFRWNDKRTLGQIEQMTGYSVKPRGIVNYFKNGGYVVYEKDGHGLVMFLFDFHKLDFKDVKIKCDEGINGYTHWRVPSTKEAFEIFSISKEGIGTGFSKRQSSIWMVDKGKYVSGYFTEDNKLVTYDTKTEVLRMVRDF